MYHLIGLAALFLIMFAVRFKANDSVLIIIGVGGIMILLLGIHLVLDRQDRIIENIVKKIEQISSDIYETKISSDFQSGIKMNEQIAMASSLESISRMLNEIKMKQKEHTLEDIKKNLEEIEKKIEEISVK